MTPSQHIDYDALALEALRGVIKACLAQVARTGLLGEHHFYIAFNTQAAGVGMSKRLKEKYPLEMTIVLQHRFWDLAVEDERFEVKLTFDGIPERLVVPFKAVKVFYDPSVPYVLQFDDGDIGQGDGKRTGPKRVLGVGRPVGEGRDPGLSDADGEAADSARKDMEPSDPAERVDRRRNPRKPKSERPVAVRADEEETSASRDAANGERPANTDNPAMPQRWPASAPASTQAEKTPVVVVGGAEVASSEADAEGEKPAPDGGAKIFDLSKFRGKK